MNKSELKFKAMEDFLEVSLDQTERDFAIAFVKHSEPIAEAFAYVQHETAKFCCEEIKRLREGADEEELKRLNQIKQYGCLPMLRPVAVSDEIKDEFSRRQEAAVRGMLEIVRAAKKRSEEGYND